jgi:hypothetical protein|tara:strand:+ start:575 stop:805 length:231 start_codon:yes stop_codon:yes gene_type:complete
MGKPKKKRLSNKPEKKQSSYNLCSCSKDTSRASHQTAMPLSKIIDVEAVIKKDKEVKETDVFDFAKKTKSKNTSKE